MFPSHRKVKQSYWEDLLLRKWAVIVAMQWQGTTETNSHLTYYFMKLTVTKTVTVKSFHCILQLPQTHYFLLWESVCNTSLT